MRASGVLRSYAQQMRNAVQGKNGAPNPGHHHGTIAAMLHLRPLPCSAWPEPMATRAALEPGPLGALASSANPTTGSTTGLEMTIIARMASRGAVKRLNVRVRNRRPHGGNPLKMD